MKRKLGWFGLGFAGAELAAAILPPLVCVPAAAFLVCLALLWIKRRRDSAIPVLGALCGLAWFLVFTLVWVRPVKVLAGQTVTCTAVVETDADASYSESRLRGTLRLTEIDGRAANVKVQCASFPGESAGERFTAKFALTERPDNKYRLSRQSKGVYLQAEYLGSYHPLDASRAPRFALYRLRQRWSATLRRWLPRQLDGIEAAMLLADKSRLDDSVQQAFRAAGVSHLLAVSGLHLALLCGLLGFGRKWKFYRPLILLRAAAALFYLLLTGMPVSVSRAGIVLLVALVGDFFLLPPDLLTSTSFAAILLGLQNAYAPCDLGFQLSFCAVLGVQAAAELARTEQRAAQDKPAAVKALCQVAEPVQTAVLASLATLPVLVAHGMAASLVGVLCNLLVVWMVQPALQLGILLLVCSAVPFLAAITNLTALVLSLWLKGLLWLVRCCAALSLRRFVCRSGTRCLRWLCWARWRSASGMPGGCGSICPRRRSAQCWPWGWVSGCSEMLCRSIWSAHPTIPASSACRTGRLWCSSAAGRATGAPCRTIWPGAADRSPRWSLTCAPSRRRWNFPRQRS